MKKLFSIALAATMALSLAGCSGNSTASTTAAADTKAADTTAAAADTTAAAGGESTSSYEPSGTLTIIVPYAAGGGVDLGSRLLAKYLSEATPVDVVVSNVAGGGGTVGAADCLKYDADGSYMLALNPSPTYVSTKDKPLTFDILKDYEFAAIMVQDQRLFVTSAKNTNFQTVEEAIEYGKANPGKFNIGCSGTGNSAYATAEEFLEKTGIEGNVVPFDGSSEAKSAVLGGHIDVAVQSLSDVSSSMNEVTILATGGEERFSKTPDVPCMTELGFPMVQYVTRGYAFKAGTDSAIINYWSDKIGEVCENEAFLKEADSLGLPIVYMNHEEAQEDAKTEMATYQEKFGDK